MTETGKKYLANRFRQLLCCNIRWDGEFDELEYGAVRATVTYLHPLQDDAEELQVVYLPEDQRGSGRFRQLLSQSDLSVVTMPDCELESYYVHHNIDYRVVGHHTRYWKEYRLISRFYENKRAERSGVPYINHIDEGLGILSEIGASKIAKKAYCIHPRVQLDKDLLSVGTNTMSGVSSRALIRAIEYRHIANDYLSDRQIDSVDDIKLSPLDDVNDMLVADKVQNYKDFLLYHDGTHERSDELHEYFNNWFDRLDVDFDELVDILEPFDGRWV